MIEINFTGSCDGCPYADLELVKLSYKWIVRCNHGRACSRIDALIREEDGDGCDYQRKS